MTATAATKLDWPALAVGGVFLLIGLAFGFAAAYQWSPPTERALAASGVPARAEVTRKSIFAQGSSVSSMRPQYRIEYRFHPPSGGPVRGTAIVESDLWHGLHPGDRVDLVYMPEEPARHRLRSEAVERDLPFVLGPIALVCAAVGAWLVFGGLPHAPAPEGAPPGLIARVSAWFGQSLARLFGILFLVPLVPMGVAQALYLNALRTEDTLFELRSQATQGMVVSKDVVSTRSSSGGRTTESTHHEVTYRFTAEGAEIEGRTRLDLHEWQQLKERGPIPVVYVIGSPWLHRAAGRGAEWVGQTVMLVISGIGTLVAGGLVWWGSRRRDAPFRIPEPLLAKLFPPPRPRPAADPKADRWWFFGIALFLCLAGGWVFIAGAAGFAAERRYAAEGRTIEARITGKTMREAEQGKRGTEYVALYAFQTPEGSTGEGRAILTTSAWEAAKAGDPIRVRYLAGDPRVNRLAEEGGSMALIIMMIVGAVLALGGGLLGWRCWRARNA